MKLEQRHTPKHEVRKTTYSHAHWLYANFSWHIQMSKCLLGIFQDGEKARWRPCQISPPWGWHTIKIPTLGASRTIKIPTLGTALTIKIPWSARPPPLGLNIDRCITHRPASDEAPELGMLEYHYLAVRQWDFHLVQLMKRKITNFTVNYP